MQKNTILSKTIAAAASLALLVTAAQAATLVNGTTGAGELFIGFRASSGTGLTKNVVMDLGSVSALSALTTGSTLSLGNLGSDLVAQFGANWYERTDLTWGAVAGIGNTATGGDPTNTLYGGVASTATFPLTTVGYTRAANGAQGSVATQILTMASGGQGFTAAAAGASSNIGIENTSDASSWSSRFGASPFAGFSAPSGQQFEQAFSVGSLAAGIEGALDVYRMFKTGTADADLGGATTGAGSYQFTLEISNSGAVSANALPLAPVPEPASIGALTSLALVGVGTLRRKRVAKA